MSVATRCDRSTQATARALDILGSDGGETALRPSARLLLLLLAMGTGVGGCELTPELTRQWAGFAGPGAEYGIRMDLRLLVDRGYAELDDAHAFVLR